MTALRLRSSLLLVLTAMIWGAAFVAQSSGGQAVGPYTFCCIRSLLAAAVLIPTALLRGRGTAKAGRDPASRRLLLRGGVGCGVCLCTATVLQQLGLNLGTEPGKAGFLAVFYVLLVPLIGLFAGRRCGRRVWIAAVISLLGLYLLCMSGSLHMRLSDGLVLLGAAMSALHILAVDRVIGRVDAVRLSAVQFLTSGVLTLPLMLFADLRQTGAAAWAQALAQPGVVIALLYAGCLSSGLAYTLQSVGQRGLEPTVASLIMSLESVFAVLAGWLILGQAMTARQLCGCLLIFCAVVLAQLPQKSTGQH